MTPAAFLRSARLEFRIPEEADVPRLAGWINDPDVRRHLDAQVFPKSLQFERDWVARIQEGASLRREAVFLVSRQSDQEPIGTAGLHGINWLTRSTEFGLVLGREHWRQGYGREISERMVRYAFDDLNLNAVRLRVNASHERGIRCYEHVGFVFEGALRQAAYRDGHFEDQHIMSVLRSDWARRGAENLSVIT